MVWWISPGDPARRTGGFLYNARMVEVLRGHNHEVRVLRMDADWPLPAEASFAEQLGQIPDGDLVVADGLMWTGLSAADRETLTDRCPVWVVVHSPLDMEGSRPKIATREREALRQAAGWWATSRPTADLMATRLSSSEAHCICPGTEATPSSDPRPASRLLTVAHLIPRKGHDCLLDALASLRDLDWDLSIVGSDTVDQDWSDALRTRAASLGLSDRLSWLGTLDGASLQSTMAAHGLLVHPARYEAYGMVLTEALASGLPVLSTEAGALYGLRSEAIMHLPATRSASEWSAAIRDWLTDEARQARATSAAAALTWPSWEEQGRALATLLPMPGV